ncbi:MAG: esterase/lipase family protein [Caldimonas sp.]
MLARLQQLIVFGLIVSMAAWSIHALRLGHPLWIVAGALALVGVYAGVLGLEFWRLSRSYEPGSPDRPAFAELISAWRIEVLLAPRVFLWQQPFRSRAIADFDSPGADPRRGVVLLHGFVCNRGLWNPWMRDLRTLGISFIAPSLEPVFGSIDRYTVQVDEAVRSLEARTGMAPIIVAHSMGGLAARAWLAKSGGADRFHRVVTIATPHCGTWMARLGRSTNGLEMRVASPWLEALARMEPPQLYSRFTCFWGRCDNIVFPTRGATLPGADNRHLSGTPHVAMAYHPAVFDEVVRLVEAE